MKPFRYAVAACVLASGPAMAAGGAAGQYRSDREYCDRSPAVTDRQACRREAGAALAEARRGKLDEDAGASYEKNRLARCAVHTDPAERDYCERRMRGEGTTSGTVEGGGILRELTVTVPAEDSGSSGPAESSGSSATPK